MSRPCKYRWVGDHNPGMLYKPAGVPARELETINLQLDELEALRQAHLLNKTQEEGAAELGVSRSTFARILERASAKVSDALVNGKALIIEGGPVIMAKRTFLCRKCGNQWEEPFGTGRPQQCPACCSADIYRSDAGPRGVCGKRGGGRRMRNGQPEGKNNE